MAAGGIGVVLHNVSKGFADQQLFDEVSFSIGTGERIGLLGRNGHGKSTLFRLILGIEAPDDGSISIPRDYRIGHLAQHISQTSTTVLAEAALGLPVEMRETPYEAERVLDGLGFDRALWGLRPEELSGGYRLRLELTKLLIAQPNLLLLDEPTNYLDIDAVRWLRSELRSWPGELMMISHDRDFLDAVTTHTAGIYRQRIKKQKGSTGDLIEMLKQEDEIYLRTRDAQIKRKKEIEEFAARYRAQASKAKLVQSRLKELEKLDIGDSLGTEADLSFRFSASDVPPKRILEAQEVGFQYENGPILFEKLTLLVRPGDRIGVIGRNGRGKSTLLRCLIGELVPKRGEVLLHERVRLGYFGQSAIESLQSNATVEEEVASANGNLSRTAVRSICGAVMFPGSRAERPIRVLSGGERSRVLLGKLLAQPSNLLVLDEPTNHLDLESVEGLVEAIGTYPGGVMVVTHNEYVLRKVATTIVAFGDAGVEVFAGTYEEYCEQRGFRDSGGAIQGVRGRSRAETGDPGKDSDGSGSGLGTKRPKKKNEQRLRKLEKRFEEIGRELVAMEGAIQVASERGNVLELMRLTESRRGLEAEQLSALEEIERFG
jgi:ATP-binding cassette subfamily F protein 3